MNYNSLSIYDFLFFYLWTNLHCILSLGNPPGGGRVAGVAGASRFGAEHFNGVVHWAKVGVDPIVPLLRRGVTEEQVIASSSGVGTGSVGSQHFSQRLFNGVDFVVDGEDALAE